MERRFKIGDKVRILDGSNIPDYTCGWTEGMERYVGEVREIEALEGRGVRLNGLFFITWDERGLEPVDVKPVDAEVIFNGPATIVLWADGTKTVVKCQWGDTFDPEKGIALCYMKKYLGNTSRALNNELHKHLGE